MQIAPAVEAHKAKVTVYVPVYAMAAAGKPGRPRSGASRWHPARRPLGGGFSGLGRLIDLHEAAVLHIVNVAVDQDVLRH